MEMIPDWVKLELPIVWIDCANANSFAENIVDNFVTISHYHMFGQNFVIVTVIIQTNVSIGD